MLDKMMGSDNKFHKFMGNLFYMAVVNIFWIVCCLPVFTIGASTTAMYAAAFKIVRGKEGRLTDEFFGAFKRNFRQALPITVIMLFTAALLATVGYKGDVEYTVVNGRIVVEHGKLRNIDEETAARRAGEIVRDYLSLE